MEKDEQVGGAEWCRVHVARVSEKAKCAGQGKEEGKVECVK